MENKKNQFFGFTLILLVIGFLQYFRKVASGNYNLSKVNKILYLSTMITFSIGTMYVLFSSEMKNILAFGIGLLMTTMSENIAKIIILVGDNFNSILVKLIKKWLEIDVSNELKKKKKIDANNFCEKSENVKCDDCSKNVDKPYTNI